MGSTANGIAIQNEHIIIVSDKGNITKIGAISGKILWSTTFGGDTASNVAFDSTHNFLVVGRKSTGFGNYQWYFEYYDGSTNSLIWSKETEISGRDVYCSACTFDNEGYIIAAGRGGPYYPTVGKFSPDDGKKIWSFDDYDGFDWYPGYGEVCVDSENNIIVAGRIQGSHYRAKVVKLDSMGNVLWSKKPGSESSGAGSVDVDIDNNILVGLGEGEDSVYNLFKYSSSGSLLWEDNNFGSEVKLYHSQQTIANYDKDIWIVGGLTNDGKNDMTYYFIDKKGNVIDYKRIDLGKEEYIRQIECDLENKRIVVLGNSDGVAWGSVIKIEGDFNVKDSTEGDRKDKDDSTVFMILGLLITIIVIIAIILLYLKRKKQTMNLEDQPVQESVISPTYQDQSQSPYNSSPPPQQQRYCSTCGQVLTFYSQNNRFYCNYCKRYE